MVAENTSGSQTATVTNVHILATIAGAGVFVLRVDTDLMAEDDRVVLRVFGESRTSETALLLLFEAAFSGVQIEVLKDSPPVATPASGQFRATLQQTHGATGRVFEWSVIDLAS